MKKYVNSIVALSLMVAPLCAMQTAPTEAATPVAGAQAAVSSTGRLQKAGSVIAAHPYKTAGVIGGVAALGAGYYYRDDLKKAGKYVGQQAVDAGFVIAAHPKTTAGVAAALGTGYYYRNGLKSFGKTAGSWALNKSQIQKLGPVIAAHPYKTAGVIGGVAASGAIGYYYRDDLKKAGKYVGQQAVDAGTWAWNNKKKTALAALGVVATGAAIYGGYQGYQNWGHNIDSVKGVWAKVPSLPSFSSLKALGTSGWAKAVAAKNSVVASVTSHPYAFGAAGAAGNFGAGAAGMSWWKNSADKKEVQQLQELRNIIVYCIEHVLTPELVTEKAKQASALASAIDGDLHKLVNEFFTELPTNHVDSLVAKANAVFARINEIRLPQPAIAQVQ